MGRQFPAVQFKPLDRTRYVMCAPAAVRASVHEKMDRNTKHYKLPQVFLGKDGILRNMNHSVAEGIDPRPLAECRGQIDPRILKVAVAKRFHRDLIVLYAKY